MKKINKLVNKQIWNTTYVQWIKLEKKATNY